MGWLVKACVLVGGQVGRVWVGALVGWCSRSCDQLMHLQRSGSCVQLGRLPSVSGEPLLRVSVGKGVCAQAGGQAGA